MRFKSKYLMAGLLLMQLGVTQAEAACQITPENSIAYPGQSVQLQISCNAGEVFSTVRWTAKLEGAVPPPEDLTGDLAVPNVTSDKIVYNLPVSTLGDVTSTAKVYLLGVVNAADVSLAAQARLILNPASNVALTVTKSGAGTGTVVSGPSGINCGTGCTTPATGSFPMNSLVMLNATAGSNAYFSGWTGDCVGTGNCQVNMTGAKSVTAMFGAVENGQCGDAAGTPRTTAPTTNLCADSSTPTVTPSTPEYSWTCAGTPNLGSSATCTAPRQYTVSVDATTNGTLSPNTAQSVTYGQKQLFTITRVSPFSATLDAASNCGGTVAPDGLSYETAAITQNCTVKMNFTNTPTCGSANGVQATAAPSGGALCSVGTASAVTTSGATSTFDWTCSAAGQTTAICQAPKVYNVTVGSISGGTLDPSTTQVVAHGQSTSFTLTPTTVGHVLSLSGTTCGGNLSPVANQNGSYTYTTGNLTANCTVTGAFGAPATGCPDGCTCGSNVIIVDTNVPTSSYGRVDFSSVAPEKVYAFKIKTRPDTILRSGNGTATRMTSGVDGKRVVLSTCPGSTTPVNAKCTKYANESVSLSHYTNTTNAGYCYVNTDAVYYFNVFSKANTTDEAYNCGSPTSPATPTGQCAFSFTAN